MIAILRREMGALFTSAIGYVFLGAFFIMSGFIFVFSSLANQSTDMRVLYVYLYYLIALIVPLLTMRLFSEERKQKTEQILLTSPVKITSIVLGKYFAAALTYAAGMSITLVYAVVIQAFESPDWAVVFGHIIGLFLHGLALIAIGMFISSLTENQVVAAVGSIAVMFLLLFMDSIVSSIRIPFLANVAKWISFNNYYSDFTMGILNLSSVIFYISVIALFCFLTVRVIEKRRWS